MREKKLKKSVYLNLKKKNFILTQVHGLLI